MFNSCISCHLAISFRSTGIVNNKPSYSFDIYWYTGQTEKIYIKLFNLVLVDIKTLVRVGRYSSLSTRNHSLETCQNLDKFISILSSSAVCLLDKCAYFSALEILKKRKQRLVAMMLLVIRSLSHSKNDCLE